jgi:hypothetical protein
MLDLRTLGLLMRAIAAAAVGALIMWIIMAIWHGATA